MKVTTTTYSCDMCQKSIQGEEDVYPQGWIKSEFEIKIPDGGVHVVFNDGDFCSKNCFLQKILMELDPGKRGFDRAVDELLRQAPQQFPDFEEPRRFHPEQDIAENRIPRQAPYPEEVPRQMPRQQPQQPYEHKHFHEEFPRQNPPPNYSDQPVQTEEVSSPKKKGLFGFGGKK